MIRLGNFGPGNRVYGLPPSCNRAATELPILLQNALLLSVRETRDALRMMHNRTTNFPEFSRTNFPRQHCAGIGELGFPSAWHLPRLDRLRLFDCDRAVRPDGQLHCISVACRYFRWLFPLQERSRR